MSRQLCSATSHLCSDTTAVGGREARGGEGCNSVRISEPAQGKGGDKCEDGAEREDVKRKRGNIKGRKLSDRERREREIASFATFSSTKLTCR